MHSKGDNTKIMNNDKAEKVIEDLFQSFLSKYQIGLEISMKGSDFMFDSVYLLCYTYHEINFKWGGSYIDSPDWTKKQKKLQKTPSIKNIINAFHMM